MSVFIYARIRAISASRDGPGRADNCGGESGQSVFNQAFLQAHVPIGDRGGVPCQPARAAHAAGDTRISDLRRDVRPEFSPEDPQPLIL